MTKKGRAGSPCPPPFLSFQKTKFYMENGNLLNTTAGRRTAAEGRTLRETFILNLEHGLHARPCALLVKTLRPYRCRVEVQVEGEKANGNSIMGLMALAAVNKSKIDFSFTGLDAPQAVEAVRHLFETRFEDAYTAPVVRSFSS